MSRQASKSLIGAFVLVAAALLVTGVVAFGSRTLLTKTSKNVLFFEGSVKGLKIGAPVMFRGVRIGQVTDIVLQVSSEDLTGRISVYIEIYQNKLVPLGGALKYDEPFLRALVDRGLRAQLKLESFLTGQLMVNLDFYPNTPIRLVDPESRVPEIPTIPSGLEHFARRLEELPIEEIAERLNSSLAGIDRLLNSSDLDGTIRSINQLLTSSDALVSHLDVEIDPVAAEVKETAAAVRAALSQLQATLRLDEGVPGEIASRLTGTLSAAQQTLEQVGQTVANVDGIAARNANLGYEVSQALRQISELSRSVRALTDYLERHPEALISGKRREPGEPDARHP